MLDRNYEDSLAISKSNEIKCRVCLDCCGEGRYCDLSSLRIWALGSWLLRSIRGFGGGLLSLTGATYSEVYLQLGGDGIPKSAVVWNKLTGNELYLAYSCQRGQEIVASHIL